jgi:hypothetical protein
MQFYITNSKYLSQQNRIAYALPFQSSSGPTLTNTYYIFEKICVSTDHENIENKFPIHLEDEDEMYEDFRLDTASDYTLRNEKFNRWCYVPYIPNNDKRKSTPNKKFETLLLTTMFLFATDPTYALHVFQPNLAGCFEVYVAGIIELNEGENIGDWFLQDKIDSRSIHYTILSFVPVYDHIPVAVNFFIHKWPGSPLKQLAVELYSFSATVIHFITNQNEELRILSYPNKRMYDIFKKVFGDQLAALFENFMIYNGSELTTSTLCIRNCLAMGEHRISSKAIDLATFFKKSYGATDIDYSNVKNWKNDDTQNTDWYWPPSYWGNTSTGKDGKEMMAGGHIHGKKRRHRRVSCTSRKGVCCVQRRRSHKPHISSRKGRCRRSHKPHISSRKGRCRRSHKPHVNTRIKPRMLR